MIASSLLRSFPAYSALPLACALLLTLLSPLGAKPKATVRVAAESVVAGDRITLGEIAEIVADDAPEGERLRAISLGYAPNVGAVREIERPRLLMALVAAGFPAEMVRVEAPSRIVIRRAAQIVSHDLLIAAAEKSLLSELRAQDVSARLVRLDLPTVELPSGQVEVRVAAPGARDLLAPFVVSLELLVEGRVVRRVSATAQVEVSARLLVAKRDLPAGARLGPEDVAFAACRLERPLASYVREAKLLRGRSLRRPFAAGEPLIIDQLAAEIVVRPGDVVRIVGEGGKLRVSVTGEARAAGRIGDRIQVRNSQSGASLQAVVEDEGEVRVRF